jgi:homoserine O-succinyltransferase
MQSVDRRKAMPIVIPKKLPAFKTLTSENIFVISENRSIHQDIRPLRIIILNLMPTKVETETQLLRHLGNTPLQVEVTLLSTESYQPKNVSEEHLSSFYKTFNDIKDHKYDGLIITGAPIELLEFEDVEYWDELTKIMDYARENVTSTLYICWGSQAGLYYHYGVPKYQLDKKMFGVFSHTINNKEAKIVRGFDEEYYVPHSRHTEVRRKDIENIPDLEIISESEESGVYMVASKNMREIFVSGHSEYDKYTLKNEYIRDITKGKKIDLPRHYFEDNDPNKEPVVKWRGHAHLLFSNWLNYCVYQETPFNWE